MLNLVDDFRHGDKGAMLGSYIPDLWDLKDEEEWQDAVASLVGALMGCASFGNPYHVIGMMHSGIEHILRQLRGGLR